MARKMVVVSRDSAADVKWAFIVSLLKKLGDFTYRYSFGGAIRMGTVVGPKYRVSQDSLSEGPSFLNVELGLKWSEPIKIKKYQNDKEEIVEITELNSTELQCYEDSESDYCLHVGVIESYYFDLWTILRGLDDGQRFTANSILEISPESQPNSKLDFIYSCIDLFDGKEDGLSQLTQVALTLNWPLGSAIVSTGKQFKFGERMNCYQTDLLSGHVTGSFVVSQPDDQLVERRLIMKTGLGIPRIPRVGRELNIGMNFIVSGLIQHF